METYEISLARSALQHMDPTSPTRQPLALVVQPPEQTTEHKPSKQQTLRGVLKKESAPSKRAIIERAKGDTTQDDQHATIKAQVSSIRRSDQQLERLRRAFWLHRFDLCRWEEKRVVCTRRLKDGTISAYWSPSMPMPEWKRMAFSECYSIFLPINSVQNFFSDYKKEVREQAES